MTLYKGKRDTYKPFQYLWAYEVYHRQNQRHWMPSEVPIQNDLSCWNTKLTPAEKNLLTQVQIYLAQADVDVAAQYCKVYIPKLHGIPEVAMALCSIANMEAIHAASYSYTLDELGIDSSAYSAFMEIPEMWEKHLYLNQGSQSYLNEQENFLLEIARSSCFGEGMQLFSAFVILLSFAQRGLMNQLATITKYIAMDEILHCNFMTKVFNTIKEEEKQHISPALFDAIEQAAKSSIVIEDHFIDLAFAMGPIENLTKEDVKEYVRHVANTRLKEINMNPLWPSIKVNPISWIDPILLAETRANFFERQGTNYQKANTSGAWNDVSYEWAKDYA